MTVGRIMIVEDNEDSRLLAAKVLSLNGFEVIEAITGEDAVRLAVEKLPDLILMDLGLMGIDGLTATAMIKNNPATSSIPVVALTAFAMHGDRERILEAGCDGYISKPLEIRKFPEQVSGFLKGPRS